MHEKIKHLLLFVNHCIHFNKLLTGNIFYLNFLFKFFFPLILNADCIFAAVASTSGSVRSMSISSLPPQFESFFAAAATLYPSLLSPVADTSPVCCSDISLVEVNQ